MGTVDTTKPVILVIGHNVPPSVAIIDYLALENLSDQVEVTGICCTSIDASRYSPRAKIIGPMSWQLRYIRSGIPDVIVVDEQCIRTDALGEAQAVHTPFIATSEKNCLGLPDRTHDPADAIVGDLAGGRAGRCPDPRSGEGRRGGCPGRPGRYASPEKGLHGTGPFCDP